MAFLKILCSEFGIKASWFLSEIDLILIRLHFRIVSPIHILVRSNFNLTYYS